MSIFTTISALTVTTSYAQVNTTIPPCVGCTMEDAGAMNSEFFMSAKASENSQSIFVNGYALSNISDVTFRVTSPSGNSVVSIVQVSLDADGNFATEFHIGPSWIENGFYKITAMQGLGNNSLHNIHVFVEINDGLVSETNTDNSEDIRDNSEVIIEAVQGSGAPGCEETRIGCYTPSTATVDVGGVVIFSNTDSAAHTFTSGDPDRPETVQALFDSSLVMAGSTYEWSPTEAGDVPYFCMVHPWMIGLIIVSGENTSPTPRDDLPVPVPNNDKNKDNKIKELLVENRKLSNENSNLKNRLTTLEIENKNQLNEIDRLKTLLADINEKIQRLNDVVTEQIKVIYEFVVEKK